MKFELRKGLGAALVVLAVSSAAAPSTGSFTLVQPLNQFRRSHTATRLLDGRVLVAGGAPFDQAATSELFDSEP